MFWERPAQFLSTTTTPFSCFSSLFLSFALLLTYTLLVEDDKLSILKVLCMCCSIQSKREKCFARFQAGNRYRTTHLHTIVTSFPVCSVCFTKNNFISLFCILMTYLGTNAVNSGPLLPLWCKPFPMLGNVCSLLRWFCGQFSGISGQFQCEIKMKCDHADRVDTFAP